MVANPSKFHAILPRKRRSDTAGKTLKIKDNVIQSLIWRFQIYNLFRQKFKFRGFTKSFKNFAKYIIAFIFAKFKCFAKKFIYLESPDHSLQNDI